MGVRGDGRSVDSLRSLGFYKQSHNATSIFVYDGDNLREESNSSGAVVTSDMQTREIDEPLSALDADRAWLHHFPEPVLVNTYTYESFGEVTASTK